jgi:hypothetical protein
VSDQPTPISSRVLLVEPDKKALRVLERSLKSVVTAVDVRERLGALPPDGEYDLIVLALDGLGPEEQAALTARYAATSPATRLLLLSSGDWTETHRRLFHERITMNVLARSSEPVGVDDIIVTLNKILARNLFGIEKYFPWGSGVVETRVHESFDVEDVVEQARVWARNLGVSDRLCSGFGLVTDELLTNALYNAPVDAQGAPLYASRDRALPVAVDVERAAVVKFCSDGHKIGVSVRDSFGSLSAEVVLDYLVKCFRKGADQIDQKEGGAGLGFFQMFSAVSHFVVNIAPGRAAEAIGIIDVRGSFRDFAQRPKSFNIFVDAGP